MADDARPISPLLEFDPATTSYVDPSEVRPETAVPRACVLTWFRDAAERLVERYAGRLVFDNRWEDGSHPVYEVDVDGWRVAVVPMPVGAAGAGNLLEEVIALGCRSFVACGGAGSLRSDLTLGHLVVVTSALRDEGLSHHYLPPGRVVDADPAAVSVLAGTLTDHDVPHLSGRTWTTDAFFRETHAKIAARRAEDCLTVDMEAASIAAVAQFRGVPLAQLLYGGDDLSGTAWDHRGWQSQHEVRDHMLTLAAEAAVRLEEHRVRASAQA